MVTWPVSGVLATRTMWLHVALVIAPCAALPGAGFTQSASQLRRALLTDYDKLTPPISSAGTNPIKMEVRFFKIESVQSLSSVMRLKVWLRLLWRDERLSWDPKAHGGVDQLWFNSRALTDPEATEIWLPDVQAYNSGAGIEQTLDPATAMVSPTGDIFWSRPGVLEVLCRFSGLVAFPFDQPSCSIEFGGWSLSGVYQGLMLKDLGWADGTQEATAGSSYQEYQLKNVTVVFNNFDYEVGDGWPVVRYDIVLSRQDVYHQLLILVPGILLTTLSQTVFFMSPTSMERLSFGITLILANEVTRITIAAYVPVCGELLWVDMFLLLCTVFTTFALLESAIVLFLTHHTDKHLYPNWVTLMAQGLGHMVSGWLLRLVPKANPSLRTRIQKWRVENRKSIEQLSTATVHLENEQESSAGFLFRRVNRVVEASQQVPSGAPCSRPSCQPQSRGVGPGQQSNRWAAPPAPEQAAPAQSSAAAAEKGRSVEEEPSGRKPQARVIYTSPLPAPGPPPMLVTPPASPPEAGSIMSTMRTNSTGADHSHRGSDLAGGFVLASKAVLQVLRSTAVRPCRKDESNDSGHSRSESEDHLPEAATEWIKSGRTYMGPTDARKLLVFEKLFFQLDQDGSGWVSLLDVGAFFSLARLDIAPAVREQLLENADSEKDQMIVRMEWMELCVALLWDTPESSLDLAASVFEAQKSLEQRRAMHTWHKLASRIDRTCRLTPLVFLCCLIALLTLDVRDDYSLSASETAPKQRQMVQGLPPHMTWSNEKLIVAMALPIALLATYLLFQIATRALVWSHVVGREGFSSQRQKKERKGRKMAYRWRRSLERNDRAMESSVSSDGSVTKSPATKPFWTQKTRASIRSLIPSRRASSGLDKSPPRHPAGSVSVVADSRM